MSRELKDLSLRVVRGQMNRRDFMGRAAALGMAAPFATQLLSSASSANPIKGGHFLLGLNGGAATDSIDPAAAASTVMRNVNYCWGEGLVTTDPIDGTARPWLAESWEASADAKIWAFKIRKGVTFSNGKEMAVEDVVATLQRHSGEDTKSGALGILRSIGQNFRADGDNLVIELESGDADLPYLLSDYHLLIQPNGGADNPEGAIGTGAYKVEHNEPGVRHTLTPIVLRTSNAAFNGAEDAAVLFQQTCAQAGIPIEVKREPADGYWSNVWNVQPFCTSYYGRRPT